MPRKRSGSFEPWGTWPDGAARFRFRLRLADGTRTPRYDVPHGLDEKAARAYVAKMQATEDALGKLLVGKREAARKRRARAVLRVDATAADAWFDTWERSRIARGLTSTADNRLHYAGYIRDAVDGKHVAEWSAEDLRVLVALLDDKIAAAEISPKFARNVWGTASKMCADSVRSKLSELRVRDDNPAKDVEGPNRGDERAKQFLYPSEFTQLIMCEDVPHRWRRAIALAVCMFPRHGELRALRWEDVDLEHGTVHVHRAFERRTRSVKATKSGRARRFALEPSIVPLLEAMHAESNGEGNVIAMPNRMASRLRDWLARAGIKRSELLDETSKTTRPLAWHDLRATGLTWMAVRGDEPLKIMQRAGHEDFQTTQIYIRTAESLRDGFGEVFPPLPAALLRAAAERSAQAFGPSGSFVNDSGAGHGIRTRRGRGFVERSAAIARDVEPSIAETVRKDVDAVERLTQLGQSSDGVEAALATALAAAAAAGRLDDVAGIVEELRARRLAKEPNVIALDASRSSRHRR